MVRTAFLSTFLMGVLVVAPLRGAVVADVRSLGKPYTVQLVFHFGSHPSLTRVFRIQLERELRDSLQAAKGSSVRVELRPTHPALQVIVEKGLQKGLDTWDAREADRKTHFVLVDYDGNDYMIRTRQYDDWTGQPSPVVRTKKTGDRSFVARLAALMIEEDFGVTGIVQTPPDGNGKVKVKLRGAGLDVPWARWVKARDVFLLARDSGVRTRQVDWALLMVEQPPAADSKDGMCTCRLFSRYSLGNVVGMLCYKIGTKKDSLRVRLVKQLPGVRSTSPLGDEHTIRVGRNGFEKEEPSFEGRTDSADVFDTSSRGESGIFENVAFVSVLKGNRSRARVPIAIVDSSEVVIPISPDTGKDDDPLRQIREQWKRDVADAFTRQDIRFEQLLNLAGNNEQRGEAIRLARAELAKTRADYTRLMTTKGELASKPGTTAQDVQRGEQILELLQRGEKELETFIAKLEEIDRQAKDPRLREMKALLAKADLLEEKGELEQAIETLKKIPKNITPEDDVLVAKRISQLEGLWKPKSPEHEKARAFIYKEWPAFETEELPKRLDDAWKALETCKKVDDLLGPRKMLDGTFAHLVRLEKELGELNPAVNVMDEEPTKRIEELTPKLKSMIQDISKYLKSKAS